MGSWGTGAFENDAAADFVAGLIDHVHRVTSKEPVRPRWRSADTYEEARAAGKFILLAHGQDVLGGPSLLDVLRALAHIRGDADWLSNWNAPRSIAAALDIDIDEVLATMRACKGCKAKSRKEAEEIAAAAKAQPVPAPVPRRARKRRTTKGKVAKPGRKKRRLNRKK
jgi:hypothetical protein